MTSPNTTLEQRTVEFLRALEAMDAERLRPLLDPQITWRNTGLPTVRGKWVERILLVAKLALTTYEVTEITDLRTDGETVRSQRSEIIRAGRVGLHLDVSGQYTFRDGRLRTWDDRFNYIQLIRDIRIRRTCPSLADAFR